MLVIRMACDAICIPRCAITHASYLPNGKCYTSLKKNIVPCLHQCRLTPFAHMLDLLISSTISMLALFKPGKSKAENRDQAYQSMHDNMKCLLQFTRTCTTFPHTMSRQQPPG